VLAPRGAVARPGLSAGGAHRYVARAGVERHRLGGLMHVTRRRLSISFAATAGAVALALGAAPAGAAAPPAWPSGGKVPTGCASITTAGSGSASQFTFTDTTVPTVTSAGVLFAGGKRILVVPPAGAAAVFELTVVNGCSGVGNVAASVIRPDGTGGAGVFGPATTDAFAGRWTTSTVTATPANAGPFVFPTVDVRRRYDSFVLNATFGYVSSVAASGAASRVVGPWSTKPIYILRATTLTSAVSKAKVAKGKKVTVAGVIKVAEVGGYVAYTGAKVIVQTKVGTGAWKSRATLTAGATGAVSSSLKILKKTQVRLVAAQVLAPIYSATVTSATRTVKLA
jgi:hypothetical protein